MSAVAVATIEQEARAQEAVGPRISPDLEQVILEIAASERALDDFLLRSSRLHDSNLQHDPKSCLVCFTS